VSRHLGAAFVIAAACAPAAFAADDDGVLKPGSQQHGAEGDHLPPQQSNMELVSKLELTKAFGDVQPGQIADVTVLKGYAYLSSWHVKRADEAQCRGGFYVADIRNPKEPKEIGFVPALDGSYNTEGMHALSVSLPGFKGDLLAVSNENQAGFPIDCAPSDATQGGFDLWDVTDPANPKAFVRGFGDMGAAEPDPGPQRSDDYHSAFVWQDGTKAFLVAVDNLEETDTDIFDITDPAHPVQVGDFNLETLFPQINTGIGFGESAFLHDVTVKQINGHQIMLASYWDAGYVLLNVDDPSNPVYIGDSDFLGADPQLPGVAEQNGNAHYAEFSYDNKFILGADEDFDPYRLVPEITSGPYEGTRFPTGTPDEASGDIAPGGSLVGPTVYAGRGCVATGGDTMAAAPTPQTIAVVTRGVCTFQEKTESADAAGYAGVVIFNSNSTNSGCENILNMDFEGYTGNIPAVFVRRSDGLKILGTFDEATYECTGGGAATDPPAVGTQGSDINIVLFFDGWGYAHLYRNDTRKLQEAGTYAIPESLDTRYAEGFGDQSIHEWAADPTEYLGYASYYGGGMRVVSFGDEGMKQVGAFIDEGGSNFWGVEQFTGADGQRYIAGSDRDFGLYLFRYTGPGAASPPACQDVSWITPENVTTQVQLTCEDANFQNKLTVAIASNPTNGTLTALDGFKVTYVPKPGFHGVDTFTYTANDGAATSRTAQVQVFVGRCANRIDGTAVRDLINGTSGGDAVFGDAGNDTIDGVQGDDCLSGDLGSDSLSGGEGDDTILGAAGQDRIFGDPGDDSLHGGADRDNIRGASGDDEVYGDAGNDFVAGGSNNDRVSGGAGNDSIRGESGNDSLFGGSGNDSISTGPGSDKVSGGSGRDTIDAANGRVNTIRCGSGRDKVKADRSDRVSRDCEVVSRLRRTR
jgi:Ca2+-binding RTX toxin-like protein